MAKPPGEQQDVTVNLHMDKNADGRTYNLPTVDEIAAVIPGDGSEERSDHRDIILRLMGGNLKTYQPSPSKLLHPPLHNAFSKR